MIIKDEFQLQKFRQSGAVCSYIRDKIKDYIKPDMSTLEIDDYAGKLMKETGYVSAPKCVYNFPGNVCLSVNSCVAHGVPSKDIILKESDCINIDVSGHLDGYYTDSGVSIVVGKDDTKQVLCDCAKDMFFKGIENAKDNFHFKDMTKAMQKHCDRRRITIIKRLTGHGIGMTLHDTPKNVFCHYLKWDTRRFKKNMLLAVETFVTTGNGDIHIGPDKWSWITDDNHPTAQYEHTILITEDKPIILTE